MLANYKARQRHNKLMRVTHTLLSDAFVSVSRRPADITAADVVALAFGHYRIELDLAEAQRYLDAARVSRGESTAKSGTAA